MRLGLALLLALLSVTCTHSRVLHQDSCDPQSSTWQYGSCPSALMGEPPYAAAAASPRPPPSSKATLLSPLKP